MEEQSEAGGIGMTNRHLVTYPTQNLECAAQLQLPAGLQNLGNTCYMVCASSSSHLFPNSMHQIQLIGNSFCPTLLECDSAMPPQHT